MHQNNIKKNDKGQSWEAKARWNIINKYQFHAEVCAGNWGEQEGTRTFYRPCLTWAWSSGTKCVLLNWVFLVQKMKTSPPWSPLATLSEIITKRALGGMRNMSRTLYPTPRYVLWCCICLETSLSSCLGFILSFIAILAATLSPHRACACAFS